MPAPFDLPAPDAINSEHFSHGYLILVFLRKTYGLRHFHPSDVFICATYYPILTVKIQYFGAFFGSRKIRGVKSS